jgi:hypothetical protein
MRDDLDRLRASRKRSSLLVATRGTEGIPINNLLIATVFLRFLAYRLAMPFRVGASSDVPDIFAGG